MKTEMKAAFSLGLLLFAARSLPAQEPLPAPWRHQDIGAAQTPGTAEHAAGVFTLQGTMDIWDVADGCHIAWQAVHGDLELAARVTVMDNPGGVAHAKASLCIRESLDAGARHVTICVTPTDGTQLLYRDKTDGKTTRIFADAEAQKTCVPKGRFPCWLRITRRGNEFLGYESTDGETWRLSGRITLDLAAETVVGLAASSHRKDLLTKATFDQVRLSTASAGPAATSTAKRVSQLTTLGIDGADKRIVYQTRDHIEAPNWSPDGRWLVFNSQGILWRISADGSGKPERIPTNDVTGANNDHLLSPDGKTIYFSAQGHLYAVSFAGGPPRRISNDQAPARKFKYYLHGVSPDGKTLAYTGAEVAGDDAWGRLDLYTIPAAGGPDTRLTDTPAPDDGPEYSPDGKWIYFNSELNAKVPGHSQCYRMAPDGGGIEQLTHDDRVNWFPHISPDGRWVVYISFPPGTVKHPENKDVILRRMKPDGSEPADLVGFNGGQGTINVNSWSPDSKRFAFVMYPEALGTVERATER
jgi:Tol biopolymer transport system component